MVSTIKKKELQLEILPLFATPTAVSNRSIRSSPWQQTYLVPSTSQDPRVTNARAELKGTGHTAKFQQAFYLQTLPYLKPLPYNFILHLYLITLPYNNLTTKPYKPYKTLPPIWSLNSFLNSYIFVVCSIWYKTLFIVVVVVHKFCCTKSRSSPFFKSCHPFPYCCWSTVYSFTKRRNITDFSGLIKIPIYPPQFNPRSVIPRTQKWYLMLPCLTLRIIR